MSSEQAEGKAVDTGQDKNQSSALSWVMRIIFYLLGIAIITLGISLSRQTGLGISQLNAWPAVIADIDPDPGRNMGWWVGAVFILFVVLQIIILRKDFSPVQLLQIPFSLMFGTFVNLWNGVTSAVPMPNYPIQLVCSLLSFCIMAIGVSMYLTTNIVPLSAEGIVLAVSKVTGRPFPKLKQIFDIILIILAVITSLIGLHEMRYVREGTIIAALCLGPLIGVANKFVRPAVYRLCYGHPEQVAE